MVIARSIVPPSLPLTNNEGKCWCSSQARILRFIALIAEQTSDLEGRVDLIIW